MSREPIPLPNPFPLSLLPSRPPMKSFIKTTICLLLLAVGSGAAVNTCLTEESAASLVGSISIDLSGCGITDADHEDLATFLDTVGRSEVRQVLLSNNSLTSLDEGLLEGMSLTWFYANDNSLATLPADVFRGRGIKFLELHNNELEDLPADVFTGMSLTFLKITGNNLSCLPEVGQWSVTFNLEVDEGVGDCRYPDCPGTTLAIGNGLCGEDNNNAECEWDGGDCCICDCAGYGCRNLIINADSFECLNPDSDCVDDESADGIVTASTGGDDDGSSQDAVDDASLATRNLVVKGGGYALCIVGGALLLIV